VWTIKFFENKRSAFSSQPNIQPFTTLCRPDSKNGKIRLKLTAVGALRNKKKGLRPFGHRSVELGFGLCFQQSVYGGWDRGYKDAGRGLQESPESRVIADIARDRKSKTYRPKLPISQ
jgi:hypothetical protein